jgi:transposase, IS5 family
MNLQTKQRTLAMMTGFERYTKKTRRAAFLEEMNQVVPWRELCARIEPHYPKAGSGRPPIGVERMLRMYFLQQWFNLSDPGVEEALYDSAALRQFVGIDLGREPAPDETTVCKFRHLLEEYNLGGKMLEAVNLHLEKKGIRITTGTIVDATIIHAPSSTKNRDQQRDPEMHQTRKGKDWYFGMKGHVGVDSKTKLIHSTRSLSLSTTSSAPACTYRLIGGGTHRTYDPCPRVMSQGHRAEPHRASGPLHQDRASADGSSDVYRTMGSDAGDAEACPLFRRDALGQRSNVVDRKHRKLRRRPEWPIRLSSVTPDGTPHPIRGNSRAQQIYAACPITMRNHASVWHS